MKCHFKVLLNTWLALMVACVGGTVIGRANTETPGQKASAQTQEADPEYTEEEYDAYDAAVKEPDYLKRGTLLIQFIDKYPKSKLMTYIEAGYKTLLFDCSTEKKSAELEVLGEQWLKIHPGDLTTLGYVAGAAEKLGHDEKYLTYLLEIYKLQPTVRFAYAIADSYRKVNNKPKYLEWAQAIFKYDESNGDYKLRFDLVQMYVDPNARDIAKAFHYAQETLKSIELVKDPDAETRKHMRDVQFACHDLIGKVHLEQKKIPEALTAFDQALKIKESSETHYYIAMCLWNQNKLDEAMLSFAKAELLQGEKASEAKLNLEKIYKSIHNGNLTGIEKTYKKAKEQAETAEITK
jgi:tetratricopeptide (TPR) repeat protein